MTSGSSGVVLGAAMVVSSTVIYLAFSHQKNQQSPNRILRSCLSSGKKKIKKIQDPFGLSFFIFFAAISFIVKSAISHRDLTFLWTS